MTWLCTSRPLVAVIVTVVTEGLGVLPVVVIVRFDVPDPPLTGFWLNDAEAPAGSPETLRTTFPVNPPVGVMVIGYTAEPPCAMFWMVGLMLPPKSPMELFTSTGTTVVCVREPELPDKLKV